MKKNRSSKILRGFSILGLVILIHEAGHAGMLLAAGYAVKSFSIGFGPSLLEWKIGETTLALRCLPLGGYTEAAPEILTAPLLIRFLYSGGGIATNWLLGFVGALWAWRRHPLPAKAYALIPKRIRVKSRALILFIASLEGIVQVPLLIVHTIRREGLAALLNKRIDEHGDWGARLLWRGAWERRSYRYANAKRTRAESYVQTLSVFSLTIGSFNLVPLIPLDGGHLVFSLLVTGSAWAGELYSIASMAFFIVILTWPIHGPIAMHLFSKMRQRGT